MKYFFLILLIAFSISLQAQTSKRKAKYGKMNFEEKKEFLLKKIQEAKELKDYEAQEDYSLELRKLQDHFNFNASMMSKNGFFVDVLLGYGSINSKMINSLGIETSQNRIGQSVAIRFGNKWYLVNSQNYFFGIQVIYFSPRITSNYKFYTSAINYSLGNIGIYNYFQFRDNTGLELNLNGGYNALLELTDLGTLYSGFCINPEIKFRYRKLSFGADFMNVNNFISENSKVEFNFLSFNFGAKF